MTTPKKNRLLPPQRGMIGKKTRSRNSPRQTGQVPGRGQAPPKSYFLSGADLKRDTVSREMSYAAVQVPGRRGGALVTRIARIIEQTPRGMVRVALLEDVPPLAGEDVFPVSGVPRMEESGETQEVHLHHISHNVLVVSTAQVGNNSVLVFPGIKGLYRSTQPVVDVITAGSDADKVTASRLVQLWHVFQALQKAMHDLGNHVGPGEVRTDKFAVTEDFSAYLIGHLQRGEPHESQVRVRQSESNRMHEIDSRFIVLGKVCAHFDVRVVLGFVSFFLLPLLALFARFLDPSAAFGFVLGSQSTIHCRP